MAAITVLAASLADRQRSQGLALMAVGGGFATPFLLPSGAVAETALFTYEAILIAGTMFLAHRRSWPLLNVVSYGFTVLTVLAWAADYYTADKYLTTELFITLFCGMYLYIVRENHGRTHPLARVAQAILWTAPAAYYIASIAILTTHSIALLVYLLALSVAGAITGARAGSCVRLVVWLAVIAPLSIWAGDHSTRAWLVGGLAAISGVYVVNLLADLERALRDDSRIDSVSLALIHLNGLATFGCAYVLINAVNSAATGGTAAGFALWHTGVAFAFSRRHRDYAMHFLALAGSLVAIAIGLQFEGVAAVAGWAAEGVGVAWLGIRERRNWFRLGGVFVFAIAILKLLDEQFTPAPVGHVALLNAKAAVGLFVIALTYALAWLQDRNPDETARANRVGRALVTAKLLILSTAWTEILDFWRAHRGPAFEPEAQLIIAALAVASAIVWLGLVRRQEWIRRIGALVLAAAALALLSIQFQFAPSNYTVVLNGRVAAGIVGVAAMYALAMAHRRRGGHLAAVDANVALLVTAASLFTLSLLTSEIDAYWSARGAARVWSIAREGLQAIVWSSMGAFLIWTGVERNRRWIRAVGAAVLVAGLARLVALELSPAPVGYTVLINARLIAALIAIAALYGLARVYATHEQPLDAALHPRMLLLFAANALSLTLLTSEITAYWHLRDLAERAAVTTRNADSHFARELMLSISWAVYATALIVAGIRQNYAPIRYFGIALFAVTIVKVFGIDMAELDRIYRVSSIIGLGIMLLATSYLYNRFRGQLTSQDPDRT